MIAYMITNKLNGKRYIGITKRSVAIRWRQHVGQSSHSRTAIARAIVAYGKDAFDVCEIACAKSAADLNALERALIRQERTTTLYGGYNITHGGDGVLGRVVSAETRHKIRLKAIGNKNSVGKSLSPEAIAARSAKRRGMRQSAEAIERIRRGKIGALKGIPLTPEHRAKIAAKNTGKTHSEDARAKMSAAKVGRSLSPEHRAALRSARLALLSRTAAQSQAQEMA